jgi:hypothetical protein
MFATLSGRRATTHFKPASLDAVPPGRFQVLDVDKEQDIKTFVQDNGLLFKTGRGFYEFTKTENVQSYKEVVLMRRGSGDMFSGAKARELAGLPEGHDARLGPSSLSEFRVFVQSTSSNRKLKSGTGFLYEVDDAS